MTEQEKQAAKERKRAEKRASDDVKQSARYEAIKKADLASEQALEKTSKAKEAKRTERRAGEENELSARYEAIKQADMAREKAEEMKKLKAKKQPG
jgi:hypothetical protein